MFKWLKKLFRRKIRLDNWGTIPFKQAQYTVIQLPNGFWTVEIMFFFDDLKVIEEYEVKNPAKLKGLRTYFFNMVRETPDQLIKELAAIGRLFKETNTVVNVVDKNGAFVIAYDIAEVQKILQAKFQPQQPQPETKKHIIAEGSNLLH